MILHETEDVLRPFVGVAPDLVTALPPLDFRQRVERTGMLSTIDLVEPGERLVDGERLLNVLSGRRDSIGSQIQLRQHVVHEGDATAGEGVLGIPGGYALANLETLTVCVDRLGRFPPPPVRFADPAQINGEIVWYLIVVWLGLDPSLVDCVCAAKRLERLRVVAGLIEVPAEGIFFVSAALRILVRSPGSSASTASNSRSDSSK